MAPLGLVLIISEFDALGQLPAVLQWTLVCGAFASTLFILGLFAFPSSRRRWIDWNGRFWPALPVLNTVGMACYATAGFALVTGFLTQQGVAVAAPQRVLEDPASDAYTYYAWNFFNAIPYLEIPRTLGWELRLGFTDHVSPVLLLMYKLALVGPVIAIGQLAWQDLRRLRPHTAERKPASTMERPNPG
jgi:hypothetical protein